MAFPIYYQGSILFKNGSPAFSTNCCCGGTFFPCCTSVATTIVSDTEYAILDNDPTVLGNGWILISETPRFDGMLDVHCYIVACSQPPGPSDFYIQTKPGVMDPITREVTCLDGFIADGYSEFTDTATLEGETGDDLLGSYTITAVCQVQTQCAWIANLNTDGDLTWQQISGTDCLPPAFPPTTEGQIVTQ